MYTRKCSYAAEELCSFAQLLKDMYKLMRSWCRSVLFRCRGAVSPPRKGQGQVASLPVSILPSNAAGPSRTKLLICRNSSGSSPPTTVKPNPRLLFRSFVWMNLPFNSEGFRVKKGLPREEQEKYKGRHHEWKIELNKKWQTFTDNSPSSCTGAFGPQWAQILRKSSLDVNSKHAPLLKEGIMAHKAQRSIKIQRKYKRRMKLVSITRHTSLVFSSYSLIPIELPWAPSQKTEQVFALCLLFCYSAYFALRLPMSGLDFHL